MVLKGDDGGNKNREKEDRRGRKGWIEEGGKEREEEHWRERIRGREREKRVEGRYREG